MVGQRDERKEIRWLQNDNMQLMFQVAQLQMQLQFMSGGGMGFQPQFQGHRMPEPEFENYEVQMHNF